MEREEIVPLFVGETALLLLTVSKTLLSLPLLLPLVTLNVSAQIDSVTTIKGYSATMSLAEFQAVSRGHDPVAHPEANDFVYVEDCALTAAQYLDVESNYTSECMYLSAGPSRLTVGGIPIQRVMRFFSKPDHEIENEYQFTDSVVFYFAGTKHYEMARILRRKYGEPASIGDPDKHRKSEFVWYRTADFENKNLYQQTLGLEIRLGNLHAAPEIPAADSSAILLKQTDIVRRDKWLKTQTDDF